jgi:hypothetical protein
MPKKIMKYKQNRTDATRAKKLTHCHFYIAVRESFWSNGYYQFTKEKNYG